MLEKVGVFLDLNRWGVIIRGEVVGEGCCVSFASFDGFGNFGFLVF